MLNWLIWNGVHAGHDDATYVPPMLFAIYIVWGVTGNWGRFLTDIPCVLILAVGIVVWHPARQRAKAVGGVIG